MRDQKEVAAKIVFLESQLHTGVGQTSNFNTMCVMASLWHALSETQVYRDLDGWKAQLEMVFEELGLMMKLKISSYNGEDYLPGTYHKRYFVRDVHNNWLACSLPGTTLVKMNKVLCTSKMSQKKIWKTMAEGCASRRFASQNPLVRFIIERALRESHVRTISADPYSQFILRDPEYIERFGDGPLEAHLGFMYWRYKITSDQYHLIMTMLGDFGFRLTVNFSKEPANAFVLRMWSADN
jgi:hypothetical protein